MLVKVISVEVGVLGTTPTILKLSKDPAKRSWR